MKDLAPEITRQRLLIEGYYYRVPPHLVSICGDLYGGEEVSIEGDA